MSDKINTVPEHNKSEEYEKISTFFTKDLFTEGKIYLTKVSHIYDISKFWIVLKHRELDVFHTYLQEFHKKNKGIKLAPEQLRRNVHCIVLCEGLYYRAKIVNIPHPTRTIVKVQVYLVDFGYVILVAISNFYILPKKLFQVPQFAIRAKLSSIYPFKNINWTQKAVERFYELIGNKILFTQIKHINTQRSVLEIDLFDEKMNSIGFELIKEQLASSRFSPDSMICGKYVAKFTKLYEFPSFEAIENGIVPVSKTCSDLLMQCTPLDVLYKNYYTYNKCNSAN